MSDHLSSLDTIRFGIPIAKVDRFDKDPDSLVEELRADGIRMAISRVPLEEGALIRRLEDLGFRIMDVQTTYEFRLERLNDSHRALLSDDVVIAPYQRHQLPELIAITAECFENYGHYAADPRLDRETCLQVYTDFIARTCETPAIADMVLVAEIDGMVAGYLSFKIFDGPRGRYAAGGIGAVGHRYRSRNVFKMITVRGLEWGVGEGLVWEEHNVLCSNYPVNRSFSSLGFGVTRSFLTLHLWL